VESEVKNISRGFQGNNNPFGNNSVSAESHERVEFPVSKIVFHALQI